MIQNLWFVTDTLLTMGSRFRCADKLQDADNREIPQKELASSQYRLLLTVKYAGKSLPALGAKINLPLPSQMHNI